MKLMKLFRRLRELKHHRSEYRIAPYIRFKVDDWHYHFSFLPTVWFTPWIYRDPGIKGVIDIWWLNCHILIGKWEVIHK